MSDCTIYRRLIGWGYSKGKARALHGWVAKCAACGENITRLASRKNAKDALYRHVQKEHRPGSVGR